ncbi:hypothetical protein E1A91_D05G179200v1 [Gossypium mustelinum]|uniref:Uncharacterized protein n=1 Tax=Gossypium mustelinum TaxID=34275 RepID=A0A5D2UWH5_GOSMU|nr:hypothetical protein E1A91_D05G179200v1 [Gossypium mustelinum]
MESECICMRGGAHTQRGKIQLDLPGGKAPLSALSNHHQSFEHQTKRMDDEHSRYALVE